MHDDVFGWDPASHAAVHDADGEITTDRVVVPDLAASLELIATEGPATCTPASWPAGSARTCWPAAACSGRPTWRRTARWSARP